MAAFRNVYDDAARAEAYSRLEFPGTYYLAYRDLPQILARHVAGRRAVDFGCGAGRSTRFLRRLGFEAVGVDVSADMVRKAREIDPTGDYRLVEPARLTGLATGAWDAVLSAFTFDNIPQPEKVAHFGAIAGLLAADGKIVNLVSTPEIYTHEWASFSTRDYPENREARSGDVVRIVMTDVTDRRPVEDVVCSKASYLDIYREAGLAVVASHEPLGRNGEPFEWVSETSVAPWRVDVLRRAGKTRRQGVVAAPRNGVRSRREAPGRSRRDHGDDPAGRSARAGRLHRHRGPASVEREDAAGRSTREATARYANFRRFTVTIEDATATVPSPR